MGLKFDKTTMTLFAVIGAVSFFTMRMILLIAGDKIPIHRSDYVSQLTLTVVIGIEMVLFFLIVVEAITMLGNLRKN